MAHQEFDLSELLDALRAGQPFPGWGEPIVCRVDLTDDASRDLTDDASTSYPTPASLVKSGATANQFDASSLGLLAWSER